MKLKEGSFPAGSFVIKRDQPYGRLAKILLEKQNFPDPSLTTYDDTAWTMGMMSQAKVVASDDLSVLNIAVRRRSINSSRAGPCQAPARPTTR